MAKRSMVLDMDSDLHRQFPDDVLPVDKLYERIGIMLQDNRELIDHNRHMMRDIEDLTRAVNQLRQREAVHISKIDHLSDMLRRQAEEKKMWEETQHAALRVMASTKEQCDTAVEEVKQFLANPEKGKIAAAAISQVRIRKMRREEIEIQRNIIRNEVLKQVPELRNDIKDIVAKKALEVAELKVMQLTDGLEFNPVKKMIQNVIAEMIKGEARRVGFGSEDNPLGKYLLDCCQREIANYVSKNMMVNFNTTNKEEGW